jgi:hypothetical protein
VLAEHSTATKHSISFNITKTIADIHAFCPDIIREAFEITDQAQNFNHKDGYRLCKTWLNLFVSSPSNHLPP